MSQFNMRLHVVQEQNYGSILHTLDCWRSKPWLPSLRLATAATTIAHRFGCTLMHPSLNFTPVEFTKMCFVVRPPACSRSLLRLSQKGTSPQDLLDRDDTQVRTVQQAASAHFNSIHFSSQVGSTNFFKQTSKDISNYCKRRKFFAKPFSHGTTGDKASTGGSKPTSVSNNMFPSDLRQKRVTYSPTLSTRRRLENTACVSQLTILHHNCTCKTTSSLTKEKHESQRPPAPFPPFQPSP